MFVSLFVPFGLLNGYLSDKYRQAATTRAAILRRLIVCKSYLVRGLGFCLFVEMPSRCINHRSLKGVISAFVQDH